MGAPLPQKPLLPSKSLAVLRDEDTRASAAPNPEQRSGAGLPAIVLGGAGAYATLRYNVLKGVPWSEWPLYTLNKAFGFASLALIVAAVVRYRFAHGKSNATVLSFAGAFGAVHSILSILLLQPANYPKFFEGEKFTAFAGLSMLAGAVAAVLFLKGASIPAAVPASRKIKMLVAIAVIVAAHTALQGFGGWWLPATWPGGLPPITLLSSLTGIAAVVAAYGLRRSMTKN